MSTEARIGHGTLLGYESAAPGVYTQIAERVGIGGPGMEVEQLDATHMDSPNGWREKIPGLKDGGEVSLELNFLPENETQNIAGVLGLLKSQELKNWQLTIPASPPVVWTLPARVSAFEPDMPVDDKMTLAITLTVSGEPTLV